MAQDDNDQWVAMVGDLLKTFPSTGNLNADVDESQNFFHEVVLDLKKLVKKHQDAGMLPLECPYLSRNAMASVTGQQLQQIKHFALKRKPKSAALRAEILQKSSDAANSIRRSSGCSVPVKIRSFAKKMDDTTPLRGIPSRPLPSGGFRQSTSFSGRFGGNSLGQKSNAIPQKEGGIKLLDITEQPVGMKEAKRRKKMAEQESQDQQKKTDGQSSAMPDYAVGLLAPTSLDDVTSTSMVNGTYLTIGATNTQSLPGTAAGSASLLSSTIQARDNLQQQLQIQITPKPVVVATGTEGQPTVASLILSAPSTTTPPVIATVQGIASPKPIVMVPPKDQQSQQPKPGLSLTREQMVEAQEMFRTSNKVTRLEKALILGFMAGARDNPCPQQGDIVNIRLSETMESLQHPDGTFRPMIVDMYFQMNYASGEWKRVKKFREKEPDTE